MDMKPVKAAVDSYLRRFPVDAPDLQLLQAQLNDHETLCDRTNFRGHITGAGIVLTPDRRRLLLINHNALGRWLQPGGHWEADEADPLVAARREIHEETGLTNLTHVPVMTEEPLVPLQISTHYIPPNAAKREPEHYHHDFRYVFVAAEGTLTPQLQEVREVRWFDTSAPEAAELSPVLARALCLFDECRPKKIAGG